MPQRRTSFLRSFWDRRRSESGPAKAAAVRPRLEVEQLEDRVVLSWGGVPPAAIAVPAAVQLSLNASTRDASGTAAITANEVDYYTFVAPVSGSYRVAATTPSSNLDTVLGVFSSTGARLAYNDDISSSNFDSQVTVSLVAGQRYYFGVTNYTGSPNGSYTWVVDGPNADDAYENNNTQAQAYNLGTLTSLRTVSNLVMADAADWYRFTITGTGASTSYVAINFTHAQGDLDLALYNAAGTVLGVSQGTTNREQISLSGLAAGTYYVRAYGYGGAFNPNYSLEINPATAATPPPPPPAGSFQITLSFTGLTASQITIFNQAAARWSQVITGDLPDATYNGRAVDDVLIDASSAAIDGVGNILGQAGPDLLRSGSLLPIHGTMQFDSADLAQMQANGTLYSVILHEMGHVLGIGTIWQTKGLETGVGTSNPLFVGANAVAAYNAIFGTNATGVPVENTGGAGTADSHWRESVFNNELMTGWINGSTQPLSRVTVASLADLGYTVNMNAADPFTPSATGLAAGRSAGGSGTGASLMAGFSSAAPSRGDLAAFFQDQRPAIDEIVHSPSWRAGKFIPAIAEWWQSTHHDDFSAPSFAKGQSWDSQQDSLNLAPIPFESVD